MANNTDSSLIHREMARKSQDVHRVLNPTNEDYKLVWDGYVDTVPAGKTLDVETFKVDKYLREMTDLILSERQQKAVDEENKRRRDRGEKEMEKWTGEAQHVLEGKFALEKGVGNLEARMKVYKQLYVGLVKEYGIEKVERQKTEATPSTHDELMSQILGMKVPESESKPPILTEPTTNTPKTPLAQMNQPQLRKIAKEKGLNTKKTDKKAELIEKISQKA